MGGAHTLGVFNQTQFAHKYVWTTDFQALNNQYYRNIAGREDWFFDDQACTRVGDAWGNKGKAVWIAKMNQAFKTGAPIQWIQKKVVCPNCADLSYERGGRNAVRLALDRECCEQAPEGAQCRPDGGPDREKGSRATLFDDDHSWGCEYSHFIFGNDESALSVDMGLFLDFDVDIRGFPYGCSGLSGFKPSENRFSDWQCGTDGMARFVDPQDTSTERVRKDEWTDRACENDCERQGYVYPGDTKSLADHVEVFADDKSAWIEEFIPTYEKMISNGYDASELVASSQGRRLRGRQLATKRNGMRGDDTVV